MKKVILSSPIILETGRFKMRELTLREAKQWLDRTVKCYSSHQTVKILGIEPATTRENCDSYNEALIVTPNKRLEFGKEYSVEEISNIGFKIMLIVKRS